MGLDSYGWLDDVWGGKGDDLAYCLVAISPFVLGAVAARWWAAAVAGAVFALSVGLEHVMWEDDPRLSGIDDLPPALGIVLVPVPVALAALGVAASRLAQRRPSA